MTQRYRAANFVELDVLGNPQINEVTKYENILVINLLLNSRPVRMSRSKSEHYKKNQVRACTTLKRRERTKNYAFNFDIRNWPNIHALWCRLTTTTRFLQFVVFLMQTISSVVVFWSKNGIYQLKWENKNEMDFDGIVIV